MKDVVLTPLNPKGIFINDLIDAILLQAAKDYFKIKHKKITNLDKKMSMDTRISEIERFFKSKWYKTLTLNECDGEKVLKLLEKTPYTYLKNNSIL